MKWILCASFLLTLCSCDLFNFKRFVEPQPQKVWGWKPVYSADPSLKNIYYQQGAHPNYNPGNIYVFKEWILQSDIGKGVHIIDKSDPQNAKKIGFIRIPGNTDVSLKGNVMYANNYWDMVALDISDIQHITELSRERNAFFTENSVITYVWEQPDSSGYYDCHQRQIDKVIIKWERDSIYSYCFKP